MEALSQPVAKAQGPSRRTWVALAAAACLAAVLSIVILEPWSRSSQLDFADGSFAVPFGDAQVVPILVSDTRIELRQARGSVSYEVVPRPERTFVVRAGGVSVQVLGTAFRVDRQDHKVEVRVERGRVEVTRGTHSVVLSAGEHVVLDDAEVPAPPAVTASVASEGVEDATSSADVAPAHSAAEVDAGAETPPPPTVRSAAELFRAADDARASGNTEGAIRLLNDLVRLHPKDPRVTMAVFTIGRLHMQQGRAALAAQSFEACGAALGGEALAEAALARVSAGQSGRAKSLASQYLERYPKGARAKEMERLAGK